MQFALVSYRRLISPYRLLDLRNIVPIGLMVGWRIRLVSMACVVWIQLILSMPSGEETCQSSFTPRGVRCDMRIARLAWWIYCVFLGSRYSIGGVSIPICFVRTTLIISDAPFLRSRCYAFRFTPFVVFLVHLASPVCAPLVCSCFAIHIAIRYRLHYRRLRLIGDIYVLSVGRYHFLPESLMFYKAALLSFPACVVLGRAFGRVLCYCAGIWGTFDARGFNGIERCEMATIPEFLGCATTSIIGSLAKRAFAASDVLRVKEEGVLQAAIFRLISADSTFVKESAILEISQSASLIRKRRLVFEVWRFAGGDMFN